MTARPRLPSSWSLGSGGSDQRRIPMRYLVLAGRVLYAAIFIASALGHFSRAEIGYAAHQGVPLANVLVPLSGLLALAGGLSVALGYRAKLGAWLLGLFLIPLPAPMPNFLAVQDPMKAPIHPAITFKNR